MKMNIQRANEIKEARQMLKFNPSKSLLGIDTIARLPFSYEEAMMERVEAKAASTLRELGVKIE